MACMLAAAYGLSEPECLPRNFECSEDFQCCDSMTCLDSHCYDGPNRQTKEQTCRQNDEDCQHDDECCEMVGLRCINRDTSANRICKVPVPDATNEENCGALDSECFAPGGEQGECCDGLVCEWFNVGSGNCKPTEEATNDESCFGVGESCSDD